MISICTPVEFASRLGLLDADQQLSVAGVADLIRTAVWRWGVCPQSTVSRNVLATCRATGIQMEDCKKVLETAYEALLSIGDVTKVNVGGRPTLCRVHPVWVPMAPKAGCLVGSIPNGVLHGSQSWNGLGQGGLVARHFVSNANTDAFIAEHDIREISHQLRSGPAQYMRHVSRDHLQGVSDLGSYWTSRVYDLDRSGIPCALGGISVLGGGVGSTFGRHELRTGRWAEAVPPGDWLAWRQGTPPSWCIVRVYDDGLGRCIDLYDFETWKWCLLARGCHRGQHERVHVVPDGEYTRWHFSMPIPKQIHDLMVVCGVNCSGWTWLCRSEYTPVLNELLASYGLESVCGQGAGDSHQIDVG